MPATGRQRFRVDVTWAATGTAPDALTKYRLSEEGYAIDAQTVTALDLSAAAMARVVLPAAIAAEVDALKFYDAPAANGTFTTLYAQDSDGSDIAVSGIADLLGGSRSLPVEAATLFYAKPVFVNSGDAPVAPGAVTVSFLIKE